MTNPPYTRFDKSSRPCLGNMYSTWWWVELYLRPVAAASWHTRLFSQQ